MLFMSNSPSTPNFKLFRAIWRQDRCEETMGQHFPDSFCVKRPYCSCARRAQRLFRPFTSVPGSRFQEKPSPPPSVPSPHTAPCRPFGAFPRPLPTPSTGLAPVCLRLRFALSGPASPPLPPLWRLPSRTLNPFLLFPSDVAPLKKSARPFIDHAVACPPSAGRGAEDFFCHWGGAVARK